MLFQDQSLHRQKKKITLSQRPGSKEILVPKRTKAKKRGATAGNKTFNTDSSR